MSLPPLLIGGFKGGAKSTVTPRVVVFYVKHTMNTCSTSPTSAVHADRI